jgi:cytochrome b561
MFELATTKWCVENCTAVATDQCVPARQVLRFAQLHEFKWMILTPQHYSTVAIGLHWAIALLIVAAFVIGLTIDNFSKAWTSGMINAHALIGLAVLILSLSRLVWRLTHRPPALPDEIGPLSRFASKAIHSMLYGLMIIVPAIGVPTLLYRGRGIDLGLLQIASPFARAPEVFRPLTELHELASYTMIALAAGHALAALYHHFIRHDDILLRMLSTAER